MDADGDSTGRLDRAAWLRERRAAVEATYDAEAPDFDRDPYPAASHAEFVQRLIGTTPVAGTILDAPCGTGRYFPLVQAAGRNVVGIDQSSGMLAQARAKAIAVRLEHLALQEIAFDSEFDGTMTIDAMENVPPEDWPIVLANLHRAVRPAGHLYLTIEEQDDPAIDAAFADAIAAGLPAVRGEIIEGDVAGYHFYPTRTQVAGWLAAEGLHVVAEGFDQEDGWAYRHLILRA